MAHSVVLLLAALLGCQRSETDTGTAPSPGRTIAAPPIVAAPSVAAPVAASSPAQAPSAVPSAEEEADEEDDNKPMGTDFEIDADASRYMAYPPVTIQFDARPMNGEPPFNYNWDFADGSPPATGPRLEHRFEKLGNYHVIVKATDKSGQLSHVELVIDIVPRKDWARMKGLDPATLPSTLPTFGWMPTPAPTP